jgi:hypothetical protein
MNDPITMTNPLIALLTDFGTSDTYVGVMKGVILTRCPTAQFIDITHGIAPQGIRQAAYLLRNVYRYFPAATIFLVVVDPGVGTDRRAVAFRTAHGVFVGPDNGVFSAVLHDLKPAEVIEKVELRTPPNVSHTFHGRDVFAPAAAGLANGSRLEALGVPLQGSLNATPLLQPRLEGKTIIGEVVHIDHFGNLITTIGPCRWASETGLLVETSEAEHITVTNKSRVNVRSREIVGIRRTYGATLPGSLLALINSDGYLEIAVNGGSAARVLQAKVGDAVEMRWGMGTGLLSGGD